MFESAMAFGKDHGYILSHDEIINHLINVLDRLEKSNTVKPAGKLSNLFSKIKYKIRALSDLLLEVHQSSTT
jgi:hypothetical protein